MGMHILPIYTYPQFFCIHIGAAYKPPFTLLYTVVNRELGELGLIYTKIYARLCISMIGMT